MRKLVLITALTISVVLCLGFLSAYGQGRPPEPPRMRQEADAQPRQRPDTQAQQINNMARMLVRLLDMDGDRKISLSEFTKFFTAADQDKDRSLSQQEMMDEISVKRQETIRREEEASGPKVGEFAPDFALKTLDGKRIVKLSDFRGREPVVLVFGSYT